MNEELYKKLALEAGGSHYPDVGGQTLRYFMKLVVLECVDIVKPSRHHEAYPDAYLSGPDGLELLDNKVERILNRFGIEDVDHG